MKQKGVETFRHLFDVIVLLATLMAFGYFRLYPFDFNLEYETHFRLDHPFNRPTPDFFI